MPHPPPGGDSANLLTLPEGSRISDYRIEGVLGKGGFGITYLARDLGLDSTVAIKELMPDGIATRGENSTVVPQTHAHEADFAWALQRFMEEARMLARLNHPNIVRVHRLIQANGTAFMVMEHVRGRNLAVWMRDHPRPTEAELRAILLPLLDGLEYLHGKELLHRDISPENIILRDDGSPVLLDFGSARRDMGKTMAVTSVVRDGYSPFEQYQTKGRQGPATDIYALAAVMIHALTGSKPTGAPDRMAETGHGDLIEKTASGRASAPFLRALDHGFACRYDQRPQSVADWRSMFLAPVGRAEKAPVSRPIPTSKQPPQLPAPLPPPPKKQQPPALRTQVAPVPNLSRIRALALMASVVTVLMIVAAVTILWLVFGGTPGQELFDEGERLWHRGDYAEAAAMFQMATERNPGFARAWLRRGQALGEANFKEAAVTDAEAMRCLEEASRLEPGMPEPLVARARLLAWRDRRDRDDELALNLLDRAQTLGASGYEPAMARVFATSGTEMKANAATAMLALDPQGLEKTASAQLWLERTRCCLLASKTQEAMVAVEKSLALQSTFARAIALRAAIHARDGRKEQSETDYAAALALQPDLLTAHHARADNAMANGDDVEARAEFDELIRLNPERGHSYLGRAKLRAKLNDRAGAIEDLNACILNAPESSDGYITRGDLHFEDKHWSLAADDYTKAIETGGATTALYWNLAAAHINNDQHELAIGDCTAALAMNNRLAYVYRIRARALHKLERYQEALSDCDEAIRLATDDPELADKLAEIHQMRARVLRSLGRTAEAEQDEKFK